MIADVKSVRSDCVCEVEITVSAESGRTVIPALRLLVVAVIL